MNCKQSKLEFNLIKEKKFELMQPRIPSDNKETEQMVPRRLPLPLQLRKRRRMRSWTTHRQSRSVRYT